MSEHIEDNQLIRLVAGEIGDDEQQCLAVHLNACSACRERAESLRSTWHLLGEWQPTVPLRDLSTGISTQIRRKPKSPMPWLQIGRAAAVLALAILGGIVAGSLAPAQPNVQVASRELSSEEAAEALGLDALGDTAGLNQVFAGGLDSDESSEEAPS